jgi:hypothetical protein
MAGSVLSPFRFPNAHSYKEHRGAPQSLTFESLIVDLENADQDARTLSEALEVAGVPAFGTSPDGFENLILVGRDVEFETASPTKARVALNYERKGEAGLSYSPEGGATLVSIASAVDALGNQVTVSHGGQTQGGEIQVEYPISTIRMAGLIATSFPWVTSHQWVGRLNAKPWGAASAGVWKCIAADYIEIDQTEGNETYHFSFEFQADFLGHQPQIWYIDPSTGKPPAALVSGVGYKTIAWFPSRDFNQLVVLGG